MLRRSEDEDGGEVWILGLIGISGLRRWLNSIKRSVLDICILARILDDFVVK